jgi:hypothetical protein
MFVANIQHLLVLIAVIFQKNIGAGGGERNTISWLGNAEQNHRGRILYHLDV